MRPFDALFAQVDPVPDIMDLKDGSEERFYVRTGAATTELRGGEAQEYIRQRF